MLRDDALEAELARRGERSWRRRRRHPRSAESCWCARSASGDPCDAQAARPASSPLSSIRSNAISTLSASCRRERRRSKSGWPRSSNTTNWASTTNERVGTTNAAAWTCGNAPSGVQRTGGRAQSSELKLRDGADRPGACKAGRLQARSN